MTNNNISDLINQSAYSFYFLVVDQFLDINLYPLIKNFHLIYSHKNDNLEKLKAGKTPYFCLEEEGISLEEKNTGKLLSHPKVIEYINKTAGKNKIAIIPFKPSSKIDFLCRKNAWTKISNQAGINRFLEDKIKFIDFCRDNKLPIVPCSVDKFNRFNFEKYRQQFGRRLVIQTHFGWAGNSTFMADSWDKIKREISENAIVKYSPFLEGYSLLNNCCLTKYGLLQSPPALQYTGLKDFTENPFATVGRQWPSFTPVTVSSQIREITANTASALNTLGYKGFFGLDFLVNENCVYLLECNPRLTASFAFYTEMELKNGLNPLLFFHIAEFLNLDYLIDPSAEDRFYNENLIGSELTERDKNNNTVKKIHCFEAFSSTYDPIKLKPSVYKLFRK